MFEPIIRWFRLNVPGCEALWIKLNWPKILRDRKEMQAMLERHKDRKGGSE
jgi:hypothetical protein